MRLAPASRASGLTLDGMELGAASVTEPATWDRPTGAQDRRSQEATTPRLLYRRVFLDRVRMLQPRELDREALIEMTHHPAGNLAERNKAADLGALLGGDRPRRRGKCR